MNRIVEDVIEETQTYQLVPPAHRPGQDADDGGWLVVGFMSGALNVIVVIVVMIAAAQ